ncbi:MFS general substrate transporter [Paxillus ammoniavirescens]|nr:MFS general substrate transporter [Paxillus ammoniavirescens]
MSSSTIETRAGTPTGSPEPRAVTGEDARHIVPSTDFGFLPIPKRLRYDPNKPFHFGLLLNASFAFASTFIVANLNYCQPLLIELSKSFDVTYDEVAMIPALTQAGYATGLLLISPLGDLVRRRQLVLMLVFLSTTLLIGLAITPNLRAFEAICFLIGVVNVTPQILIPLAADLAMPERRASALAMILSGLLFGVLIARVLAGVIGNFSTWRIVYYMAIGIQCFVLVGAYFILPDYPAKNHDLTYFKILFSMAKYAVTEPLVIQCALVNATSSACYTGFWVTLTFLLGGPPYYYSTLDIGLFGLVGMLGVVVGPFVGRLVDRLIPWYATLVATFLLLAFQAVQTAAGGSYVWAVIIVCFGMDVAFPMQQVSLVTRVLSISTAARARLNAIFILSLYVGQVMGSSVGTDVFVRHGWRACALLMLALYGFQLPILLLRGPHCPRTHWFGWAGGFGARKSVVKSRQSEDGGETEVKQTDSTAQVEKKMEEGFIDQTTA